MKIRSYLKQFLQNTAGNFSIIGAITLTSSVSIIGVGIDMQRSYLLQSSLQSAVDAAAMSGAISKSGLGDEASFGERRNAALMSLKDNTTKIQLTGTPQINVNQANNEIEVEATAMTDYLIMSLFGHENQMIRAKGKAAFGVAEDDSNGALPTDLINGPDNADPNGPADTQDESNLDTPLSIAFVLDNSTTLLRDFDNDTTLSDRNRNGASSFAMMSDNEDKDEDEDEGKNSKSQVNSNKGVRGFNLSEWYAHWNAQRGGNNNQNGNGNGNAYAYAYAYGHNEDNASPAIETTRLDVLKNTAEEYYEFLDDIAETNPALRQNIRTALLPYNDGLDNRFQVALQPGWTRTAAQTRNMQPKRMKLPLESFELAQTQLNDDRETNEGDSRKLIIYMGDGELDRGFEPKTETELLIESCQRAKENNIEIYSFAMDVESEDAQYSYRMCASPNGSISGYGPIQAAIDETCRTAKNDSDRAVCLAGKSEYFSLTSSHDALDDFWGRLNPVRRPAPSPDAQNGTAVTNTRQATARLIR